MNIQQDHAEISKLLDEAILSEDPLRSFHAVLPKIQSFASVDSAWISGNTFYVRYKNAGNVSWTAPIKNTN